MKLCDLLFFRSFTLRQCRCDCGTRGRWWGRHVCPATWHTEHSDGWTQTRSTRQHPITQGPLTHTHALTDNGTGTRQWKAPGQCWPLSVWT